jgi:hypothetical protein
VILARKSELKKPAGRAKHRLVGNNTKAHSCRIESIAGYYDQSSKSSCSIRFRVMLV